MVIRLPISRRFSYVVFALSGACGVMRGARLLLVILCALSDDHRTAIRLLNVLEDTWTAGKSAVSVAAKLVRKISTGDCMGLLTTLKEMKIVSEDNLITRGDKVMDLATGMFKGIRGGGFDEALQALEIVPNQLDDNIVRHNDSDQRRCYGQFGDCIRFTPHWHHPKYRPLNAFPQQPEEIGLYCLVNTSSGGSRVLELSDASYNKSGFNASRYTVVYIHGYLSSPGDVRAQQLVARLVDVEQGSLNVLTVDWSRGASTRYTQAMGNSLLVARYTARVLAWLQWRHGLQLQRLHLVGHSLGAHIAGYVGAALPGIRRISGLDPARPGFENMPPEVRLDPSDALFVDVLHTDDGNGTNIGYGISQPSGHVDFYVNGGHEQPGCDDPAAFVWRLVNSTIGGGFDVELACRHNRAIDLFSESIALTDHCQFVAHECPSYRQYLDGGCSTCDRHTLCAVMGFHASRRALRGRSSVKLYLTTHHQAPFCLAPAVIQITLPKPSAGQPAAFWGRLRVAVVGTQSSVGEVTLPIDYQDVDEGSQVETGILQSLVTLMVGPGHRLVLHGGNTYGFLLRSQAFLGDVWKVSLMWLPDTDDLRGELQLPLANLTLQYMHSVQCVHGSRRLNFYPNPDQHHLLTANSASHFYR